MEEVHIFLLLGTRPALPTDPYLPLTSTNHLLFLQSLGTCQEWLWQMFNGTSCWRHSQGVLWVCGLSCSLVFGPHFSESQMNCICAAAPLRITVDFAMPKTNEHWVETCVFSGPFKAKLTFTPFGSNRACRGSSWRWGTQELIGGSW